MMCVPIDNDLFLSFISKSVIELNCNVLINLKKKTPTWPISNLRALFRSNGKPGLKKFLNTDC